MIHNHLLDRLIDRTDRSLPTLFLRRCLKIHNFVYALYQYRIGNTRLSRRLMAGRRAKPEFEKDFCARVEEICDILERGYEEDPHPRNVPVCWNRKVLLSLHYSLPYDTIGYSIRSHSILHHLGNRGLDVMAATRLGYPGKQARYKGQNLWTEDFVDGVCYIRLKSDHDWWQYPDSKYIEAYARVLGQLAQTNDISVLHAASNFINGLAAARAARTAGCKSIYEVRGLWHLSQAVKEPGFENTDHFLYSDIMECAAVREADSVVAISETLKSWIVNNTDVEPEKVTVIPNAVDINKFKPRPVNIELKKRLGLEKKTVLGFIGSLTAYEGLDFLIKAAGTLVDRGANIALLVIGHGYAEKKLKKIASSFTRDCIRFLGQVPFEEIGKYYSIIDIFSFPRNKYEVCRFVPPLKVLEAMAIGKPVIVSDLPPLLEMVTDGITGAVCRADNFQSLLTTIQRLYDNPAERQILGETARKWVSDKRSWGCISEKYVDLYRKTCA